MHLPTPSPFHPMDSVETVKPQFLWSFNILLGGAEGGGVHHFKKGQYCFSERYLGIYLQLLMFFYCPKGFSPGL